MHILATLAIALPIGIARVAEPAAATGAAADEDQLVAALASNPPELAAALALRRTELRGELKALKAGDDVFVALLTPPANTQPSLAVLFALGADDQLREPLARALVQGMADGGWLGLAIQSPTPGEHYGKALCARLTAAIDAAKERGARQVVLGAVGTAFDAGMACFNDKLPSEIAALIGLGTWRANLSAVKIPCADVTANASASAQTALRERTNLPQALTAGYRKLIIDAADDHFTGAEQEVAKRLRGWLAQLTRNAKA